MKRIGFRYAVRGLGRMMRSEGNARIHLVAALLTVTAGFFFRITAMEWVAVTICIGLVFAAEAFNTAVERVCDKVCRERDPLIGQAKDVAAGAVFVLAMMSVVVGLIIFLPYIFRLIC